MNELHSLELVDSVVARWSVITVPLLTGDANSKHRALGVGSGFVVERHGATFLVTARHVLTCLDPGAALISYVAGKSVSLNGLPFASSPEDDIAITYIDHEWARAKGLERAFPLPLIIPDDSYVKSNVFLLLGYPGSKNKLNWNANETDCKLVGYSFSERIDKPRSNTHIRNPVAFRFDKKTAIDTSQSRVNVGMFNGNSGGPVLEILARRDNSGLIKISACLAGVFIGWDKQHREIVCCRPDALTSLIDEFI